MAPLFCLPSGSFLCIFFLLFSFFWSSFTRASPANIWHISIWEAPAPPPGKGPPIADSALRDTAYLPAQISAIVAAYVFSLLIIGSAILFVGRRLRRAAQSSPKSLAMEMMRPSKVRTDFSSPAHPLKSPLAMNKSPGALYGPSPADTVDTNLTWPSPIKSPGASTTWGSIRRGHRKQSSVRSVAASSVVTFDESVIEDDKERNQREMERLYAAVMEHDDQKSRSVLSVEGVEQRQHPAELQHLRPMTQASSLPPPPPETTLPSRTSTKSPRASTRPAPLSLHSCNSSRSSLGSFGKKHGIRNLPISPPMGSPDLAPDYYSTYGEMEPLSPRLYDDPGPPPPTPPQKEGLTSRPHRIDRTRLNPQDARSPPSIALRGPRISTPSSPTVQTIPEVADRPAHDSRGSNLEDSARTPPKSKRTPAPLSLRSQTLAPIITNSQRDLLPLPNASLPLRNPYPAAHNADRTSTIKATVLERKVPNVSLRTPRTGVPMTPYSPYMPFTPLTPITPSRLVSREERKKREKEEGRRVATIDDAVVEEPDMWDDAHP